MLQIWGVEVGRGGDSFRQEGLMKDMITVHDSKKTFSASHPGLDQKSRISLSHLVGSEIQNHWCALLICFSVIDLIHFFPNWLVDWVFYIHNNFLNLLSSLSVIIRPTAINQPLHYIPQMEKAVRPSYMPVLNSICWHHHGLHTAGVTLSSGSWKAQPQSAVRGDQQCAGDFMLCHTLLATIHPTWDVSPPSQTMGWWLGQKCPIAWLVWQLLIWRLETPTKDKADQWRGQRNLR